MSFNIKNSFVSRAVVEDDKEKQLDSDAKEEGKSLVMMFYFYT
jgi:hypothetical protein